MGFASHNGTRFLYSTSYGNVSLHQIGQQTQTLDEHCSSMVCIHRGPHGSQARLDVLKLIISKYPPAFTPENKVCLGWLDNCFQDAIQTSCEVLGRRGFSCTPLYHPYNTDQHTQVSLVFRLMILLGCQDKRNQKTLRGELQEHFPKLSEGQIC